MRLCPFCHSETEANDSWFCANCGKRPPCRGTLTFLSPDAIEANFPGEAFPSLADVECGHFWFESRNRLLISTLKKFVPHFTKYLEIGCGTGFVLKRIADAFPDAIIYGTEFYPAGLEIAASRTSRAEFFQLDANFVPFRDEFEVIGAFDVLEHIENDRHVLGEIAKALKPGGYLLMTVPQHDWLWSSTDTSAGHVRRYSRRDLLGKICAVNLTPVKITSFVSFLLPFMFAERMSKKKSEKTELSVIPTPLNSIFTFAMSLERRVIEIGVSLPAGGSLMVLARKPLEN